MSYGIKLWVGGARACFTRPEMKVERVSYDVITPSAARAVGTAVGKNPVSFVVPCHRVLGKSGGLCGYHWGLTRKRAILGWEAGVMAA